VRGESQELINDSVSKIIEELEHIGEQSLIIDDSISDILSHQARKSDVLLSTKSCEAFGKSGFWDDTTKQYKVTVLSNGSDYWKKLKESSFW
ncbi:MAG: hypothetical protein AAFW70_24025, partial [Cyanobacteria bacterium J06635_10]